MLKHCGSWFGLALIAFSGCIGEPAPTTPEVTTPDSQTPPPLTAEDLKSNSENIALVPSVIETQKTLDTAGIQAQLKDLISERNFDYKNENRDNTAVRTGVIIANMLLTVKTSTKEQLLDQLAKVRSGLALLEGGKDIDAVLADYEDRVRGDSLTRPQLLKEFDSLSGAVIPELEFNGQTRVVPLIQAGSWLQGANLVAKALKQAGKPEAANGMLKQPAVVDYFIQYVKNEGAEKAPAAVTEGLEKSLLELKKLAEKQEPFTEADIDQVIQVTDDVLALL